MQPILDDRPADDGDTLPPFVLEEYLPFRLSVLANRLTRMVARHYGERFGLTAPEWRTMAVLGRFGAMTANDVVERTAMDKVRVSRAVARLLAAGHITRRADAVDRRRAILDLTTTGRATFCQIVPLVLALEAEILATLAGDERTALHDALGKIERRIAQGGPAFRTAALDPDEPDDADI
jgi:DNA-binding MarR family transcriptional regulator